MKAMLIVILLFVGQIYAAETSTGLDVHFRVMDKVADYFDTECEGVVFDEDKVSTKLTDSFYEEDKSGYFYEFSNEYNIYYGGVLIGDASHYGEGQETFGGTEEWDFALSCL